MKGKKTHLKIRFVQENDMSSQGIKNWTPSRRAKLHKKVYKCVQCMSVAVEDINSKEAIGKLASEYLWDGKFIMFGYSKGKTKTRVKLVMLCKIRLTIRDDDYDAYVTNTWRLGRYWFWQK